MTKVYITIVGTILTAFCYLFNHHATQSGSTANEKHVTRAGDEDDANERNEYEARMLRDPATGKIPANMRAREIAFSQTLPSDAGFASKNARTTAFTSIWQPRGPWNVGGRTRAMAADITNGAIIVAGSASGGMYRSTDSGATWVTTTPTNNWQSVASLAQDTRPGHTNVWYYSTGEAYGASASAAGAYYQGTGVFKSIDSGKTWTVLPSTAGFPDVFSIWSEVTWNIVTNPADTAHDEVWVAAYGAVYRSLNGGTTWTRILGTFGSDDSYFSDIAISKSGVIYVSLSSTNGYSNTNACPDKGLWRSTNGTTFTNITPVGFPDTFNRVKIGISPLDENQVYFLANTPGAGLTDTNYLGSVEWNSLWKYNYLSGTGADSGGLWRNLSANLPTGLGVFNNYTCQGSYDMVVMPKPDDTNTVFIGGTSIYRSTSGFKDNMHTSFIGGYQFAASLPVVADYANHHPDQHVMYFMPGNPSQVLSANDGGIFRTYDIMADTVAWHSLDNGYITSMFYSCAIDHATTSSVIIGGAQDNGSWYTNSTSLTNPWLYINGGDGTYCAIADSGKAYYVSLQDCKMRKLKVDASGNVDSFARIDPIGAKGYQFVNPFLLDPNNNNIMYMAGGKYLWRNDNLAGIPYASNWDTISTNWVRFQDSIPSPHKVITAIGVSKTPANRVYVGTDSNKLYRIDSANLDSTRVLRDITSTLFPGGYISCVAVNPTNADSVIVAFSNYGIYNLFFTANGGVTWSKIAGNLYSSEGPSIRWATFAHVPDGIIYLLGTSTGLYATSALDTVSTGTVWTHLATSEIGESIVNMIDYRTIDGLAVVATHSHGMFSANLTGVIDVLGINQRWNQQSTSLNLTNYPNPFNAATTIQFNLDENQFVNVSIYDELGNLVRTIANGQMSAGSNSVIFTGEGLKPGTYYCALTTKNHTESRKMLMMR